MLEQLEHIDRVISLTINSWHTPALDSAMAFISKDFFLAPVFVIVVFYVILRRKVTVGRKSFFNDWKITLVTLAATALTFLITENFGHDVIKPLVHRPRPGYDPYIWDLISLPDGKGGLYSFVSLHAANYAGFATITTLLIRKRFYKWFIWLVTLLVCFSRVYLGRHFFGDVVCGILFGIIVGYLVYFLAKWIIYSWGRNRRIIETS